MTARPMDRERLLRRALWLSVASIVINGITGGAAVIIGLSSGSLSLLGFGFDAAIDSAASVALVWRFHIESREPERGAAVERIAETVVGVVLIVLAIYLGFSAIRALVEGARPSPTAAGTAISIFSIIVLPPLAIAKYRTARSLGSGALRADSILTGVAALLAAVSLVSAILTQSFGMWWADAVGGLIVAVVLAREGVLAVALRGH